MATTITFNGTSYSVPALGDSSWATGSGNLSSYLIAIASGSLQTTGGTFTLSADVNFGGTFGIVSKYFKSVSANIASAGVFRLANADQIEWRNAANSGNNILAVNGSDQLTFNGSAVGIQTIPTRQVLTSGTGATYTTPAGCRQLRVRMVGGGGGGGAATTNNASAGNDTSFNSIVAKGGGAGGKGNTGSIYSGGLGGSGGAGSASFRTPGQSGGPGTPGNGAILTAGFGGSSLLGLAATAFAVSSGGIIGADGAANSGCGGSGGVSSGNGAGSGGGAGEYVELIINSPSATYTYTVGASANGGTAGTQAGGAGGSGVIIVDELY